MNRAVPLRPGRTLQRRTPIKPMSKKRAKENRERRAVFTAIYTYRPRCAVPGCPRLADDIHEPLTRARGGSITDPDNGVPMCREHNDMLSSTPESKLAWAYKLGLLKHSWPANGGDVA